MRRAVAFVVMLSAMLWVLQPMAAALSMKQMHDCCPKPKPETVCPEHATPAAVPHEHHHHMMSESKALPSLPVREISGTQSGCPMDCCSKIVAVHAFLARSPEHRIQIAEAERAIVRRLQVHSKQCIAPLPQRGPPSQA